MSKFGHLLGFMATAETAPAATAPAALPKPPQAGRPKPEEPGLEVDQELFFPDVTQLGEDNETVRNLLIDAEHKISELDTIKRSINKLVDPVSRTLRAFEETKSQKHHLQNQLSNLRAAYSKQRDALDIAEQRVASLESECGQMRDLISVAQQRVAALEGTANEQAAELGKRRTQVVDLQRILQQVTSDLQISRDESQRLGDRCATAEKRMVQLDAETHLAQQTLAVAEKEKSTVNGLLEKAHVHAAELSKRLAESEKALAGANKRLSQIETAFGELQAERTRVSAALEDLTERYHNEVSSQSARYESLQARATLTESLLEDSRNALTSRADEVGEFDRRVAEATMARAAAETKLVEIQRALIERDNRIKELEQSDVRLAGEIDALAKAVAIRETAYKNLQNKLCAQDELVKLLEHQLRATRHAAEIQGDEINAQLQRERLERGMAEGALEAGRKDIARLLRELSAAQPRAPSFMQDTHPPVRVQKSAA